MYKLIIFDVDGTLTTYRENACHDAPLIVLPNVAAKLNELSAKGVILAAATNQRIGGWYGRAYTDETIMSRFNELVRLLPISPELVLSSHINPGEWRKPKPAMLIELLRLTDTKAEDALYVGDRDSDQWAAESAGMRFAWAWEYFGWSNGLEDRKVDWGPLKYIWRVPRNLGVDFNIETGTLLLRLDSFDFGLQVNDVQFLNLPTVFKPKDELHITIIGKGLGQKLKEAIDKDDKVKRQIELVIKETNWRYRIRHTLYHVAKDKEKIDKYEKLNTVHAESIILMVDILGIEFLYERLGWILGEELEIPPTHVTLYVYGDTWGIGLPNQIAFNEFVIGEVLPKDLKQKPTKAMDMLERAIQIAVQAHRWQRDKGGELYILHPLRLMFQAPTDSEKIVAILHDVVEDSLWAQEDLRDEGFSDEILFAIECLTRRDDESYDHFIRRVNTNVTATAVKVLDLKDNMNVSRLLTLTDRSIDRLKRYQKALALLIGLSEISPEI